MYITHKSVHNTLEKVGLVASLNDEVTGTDQEVQAGDLNMATVKIEDRVPPTEEEIDELKIKAAVSLARQYNIDLEGCTKLPDIKCLLKLNILCKDETREKALACLAETGVVDDTRRHSLTEIYNDVLKTASTMSVMQDPVVEQLHKLFPHFCDHLEKQRDKTCTKHAKAPVLVLGETGAGKSSFINLLLGEDILPCSLLSNTHVICEIMYGRDDNCYAVMHPVNEGEQKMIRNQDGNREEFIEELARCVQDVHPVTKKPVYNKAEIYLPCDILKSGLVIVDSPGIGDTKEMTAMVLDYILEACTFIYVINSTSAGGVQTRLQDLLHHVYEKALDEQKEYRPENAIFICNKWDQVPCGERKDVWADTTSKIKKCWPVKGLESCLFQFSTKEASFIQKQNGISPQFHKILGKINQLIPVGREVLVMKGFSFVNGFVDKCLHCFGTNLKHVTLSALAREEKQRKTYDRLYHLSQNIDAFFEEKVAFLRSEIKELAKKLKKFLLEPSNMDRVCNFCESKILSKTIWKEAAVEIRAHVYDELLKLIAEWEEQNGEFKTVGVKISDSLDEKFPKFDAEIYEAEQQMSKSVISMTPEGITEEEESDPLVPRVIRSKFMGYNFPARIAIGIGLSPVLLVGLVVRLPVYGFKSLKRTFENYLIESKFKGGNNLTKLSQDYARSTVLAITDKIQLEAVIEEDIQPVFNYLNQQKRRMQAQIQSDMDLMRKLKEEERSVADIKRTYEPLQALFIVMKRRLRHFVVLHLPAGRENLRWLNQIRFNDIEVSDHVICSGLAADIFTGKSLTPDKTSGLQEVTLRKTKELIKPQNIEKFLQVESAYCNIKNDNIARCVAVTVLHSIPYQVLEPLQSSLHKYLESSHMQEQMTTNRQNTILRIMKDVVSGLQFLHDKKMVHFDLSMDTVAVDLAGKVKITNIFSSEEKISIVPSCDNPVRLEPYTHISPDFFDANRANRKMKYQPIDDMYGVGVMMWELWTGRPVCDPEKEFVCEDSEIFLEKFQECLDLLKPRQDETFHLVADYPSQKLADEWWTSITGCLERQVSSAQWMTKWKDIHTYPAVTLLLDKPRTKQPKSGASYVDRFPTS